MFIDVELETAACLLFDSTRSRYVHVSNIWFKFWNKLFRILCAAWALLYSCSGTTIIQVQDTTRNTITSKKLHSDAKIGGSRPSFQRTLSIQSNILKFQSFWFLKYPLYFRSSMFQTKQHILWGAKQRHLVASSLYLPLEILALQSTCTKAGHRLLQCQEDQHSSSPAESGIWSLIRNLRDHLWSQSKPCSRLQKQLNHMPAIPRSACN